MTAFIAEFIGTAILLLLGSGVVANVVLKGTKGNNAGWMVITTAWALAVYVAVIVASPYSGAHLNPAVTIALAVAGKFAWGSVGSYVLAQFLGAMTGVTLCYILHKDHFDMTDDAGLTAAPFGTSPAKYNVVSNFLCEMVGTFILLFVIFYIKGADLTFGGEVLPIGLGSVGAIPVALLVWVIGLSLGGTTGYAINPARDLGPRIVHALLPIKNKGKSGNWHYAWIPVVAPIVGGCLAAVLYLALS